MSKIQYIVLLAFFQLLFSSSRTIAVSYFDNTSKLDEYTQLSKGLADILITELSNIESIQIVEREKLQSLLEEISLGRSEFFDSTTAQKLGH